MSIANSKFTANERKVDKLKPELAILNIIGEVPEFWGSVAFVRYYFFSASQREFFSVQRLPFF